MIIGRSDCQPDAKAAAVSTELNAPPQAAEFLPGSQFLPGGTGDVSGDDGGGVPVQGSSGPVVSHGGSGIGVRGGFLHVAQPDPGVQRRGDERVPQRVRTDRLGDTGAAGHPADDPPSAVPVQPTAIRRQEDRSLAAPTARSIARAVRGASGTVTTLPPLRVTTKVRCPRSTPKASMSAPVASDTRSPFNASSEISACSPAVPSPAAAAVEGRAAGAALRASSYGVIVVANASVRLLVLPLLVCTKNDLNAVPSFVSPW